MGSPTFSQNNGIFAMTCRVEIQIDTDVQTVWRLLIDAAAFPNWNSTVVRIEGTIGSGQRLGVHVPGSKMVMTPTVSEMEPMRRMVWSDGVPGVFRGVRVFTLEPDGARGADFVMSERFSGLVFALVRGGLPNFREVFESYARDLKREAERIA
jgi:hypothetical protein